MRSAVVLVIAGCSTAKLEPTISNRAAASPRPLFTITERGIGPLHAKSQATLGALRAAFPGYEVRVDHDPSPSYWVYLGTEKLLWVIPNADGSLFNVHATSAKIETEGRDWRVGTPFRGASSLTDCECWGDNPTCYRRGEHVAVNFRRTCGELSHVTGPALRVLDGEIVQRVIWSPQPFSSDLDGGLPDP